MIWRLFKPFADTAGVILLSLAIGFASGHVAPLFLFGLCFAALLTLIIDENYRRGLMLLAFCIPFERLGSVDVSGMTIRPSQVVGLVLCIVAFERIARKKLKPVQLPHTPLLGLFCLLALWSLLNALSFQRSLLVTLFVLFTCTMSIVIPLLARTKQDFEMMVRAFFFSYIIVVLFGLYQWAGDLIGLPPALTGLRELYTKEILGFPRLQSTALEPLYFANYLLIPLSVLAAFFLRKKSSYPLKIILPSLGLGILALLLTVARGGYLAFAVSISVLLLLNIRTLFQARVVTVGIIGVLIAAGSLAFFKDSGIVEQFLSHVTNLFVGASYNERVHMYELAWSAFSKHPLIGVAAGGFGPFVSHHPLIVPGQGWNIVNNEYLELLAEHGFFGFITMMSIFALVAVRSITAIYKARDPWIKTLLIGCVAAYAGILAQYNTFSVLYIMHVWCLIGFLVALQEYVLRERS